MIDSLSLGISHGLILLVVWRIFWRPDLDRDDVAPPGAAGHRPSRLSSFLKGSGRA